MEDKQDNQNKLQQANAQLARAQAEYDSAKLTFDRTQALYSSKSATKPEYRFRQCPAGECDGSGINGQSAN